MLKSIEILRKGLVSKPIKTPFVNLENVIQDKRVEKQVDSKLNGIFNKRKPRRVDRYSNKITEK